MGKSKTRKKRPYWQDAPCPSWCWSKHDDSDAVPDRTHFSRWDKRVGVSLYSAAHGWSPDYPGQPRDLWHEWTEPAELVVSLVQEYREIAPQVNVAPECFGDARPGGLDLTVDEARRLAKALTTAVDMAEGYSTGGAR